MKNESLGELEQLQTLARKKGFVCMLWHIDDVQEYYDVSDEEALEIMEEAIFESGATDYVHDAIDNVCELNEIKMRD